MTSLILTCTANESVVDTLVSATRRLVNFALLLELALGNDANKLELSKILKIYLSRAPEVQRRSNDQVISPEELCNVTT